MAKVVGIDLGTTNSLVAYMDGNTPRVIRDAEGGALVPSIVAFNRESDSEGVVVGEAAKKQLLTHSDRTIYSVKRFMGKGVEDVRWMERPTQMRGKTLSLHDLHYLDSPDKPRRRGPKGVKATGPSLWSGYRGGISWFLYCYQGAWLQGGED